MKIKNNQSGIAHLAAILVVLVVVVIGVVGWKVWENNRSTETVVTKTTTKKTTTSTKATVSEPTYKGKRFTSALGGFSMELLNGWKIESDTSFDYFFQYSVDNLSYNEDENATVKEVPGSGVGGFVPGIMVSINQYNTEVEAGEKFVLNDKTVGYCKVTETKKSEDTSDLMSDDLGNFINKECSFKKDNQKLSASYSYYEKQSLDTKAVEYAFKTITFLK